MKKNSIAALIAVGLVLSAFTYQAFSDAQGGGTVVAPDSPAGKTLNTANTTLTTTEKATLRSNLGIAPGVDPAGLVIPSGTPAAPVAGTLQLTGTSVKVFLTGSTGLIVISGTVTTF